jgi:nitroimidazol reductase NimA-like FMN-containing flavoprotein (pyridoxamine 5'-phosphate oxidase superfamily)
MFRAMRRFKQEVSREECIRVLKEGRRAVLSVLGDDGYPYGVPVNFYYDEETNEVYLHGAKEGHKMDALRRCSKVSLTVLDQGYKKEGDWAWYVTSVILFGHIEILDKEEEIIEKARPIGLKYYPDAKSVEAVLAGTSGHLQALVLHIDHMTGKRVHEK